MSTPGTDAACLPDRVLTVLREGKRHSEKRPFREKAGQHENHRTGHGCRPHGVGRAAGENPGPGGPDPARGTTPARRNVLVNGDFESGLSGWNPLWTRQTAAGSASLDRTISHDGGASVRIEHRGGGDWSLAGRAPRRTSRPARSTSIPAGCGSRARAGPRSRYSCATRPVRSSPGPTAAARQTRRTAGVLSSRFVVPAGARTMTPRVLGYGPAVVHVDSLVLVRGQELKGFRPRELPPSLEASTATLGLSFDTQRASFSVLDRRTGKRWSQKPAGLALWSRTRGLRPIDRGRPGGSGNDSRVLGSPHGRARPPGADDRAQRQRRARPVAGVSLPVHDRETRLPGAARQRGHELPRGRPELARRCITSSTAATASAWPGGASPTGAGESWPSSRRPTTPRSWLPGRMAAFAWLLSGTPKRASSAPPGGCATCSLTTAATWPWQALSQARAGDRPVQDARAEAGREPQRRSPDRRGQRLVLGHATPLALVRELQAAGIERILWCECGGTRADQGAQRDGRADQPLRHLSGRDGPGQLPQAPLHRTRTGPPAAGPRTS